MGALLAQVNQVNGEQSRKSSMGHALWNALGGRSGELSVDVYKITLEQDDVLLLCTDGLYDMVAQEKIEDILNSVVSPEAACRKLVDSANANGGKDNITVIVSHFLSPRLDGPRAFVEVEVPLDQLMAAPSETTSTVRFNPPTSTV
jgi:serine/threonine protein phosphatase PrpC